jgi:uncharacterized protein YmfQ (DUF2313 family)
MSNYLKTRTTQEQADVLASYLPDNAIFAEKNNLDSNYRKLLNGLAVEFKRLRNVINSIRSDYFPENTTEFIENWETQLNIPDDCIDVSTDITERRNNVMLKLNGVNATTKEDFEAMIAAAGIDATISNAVDQASLPLTLPFLLVDSDHAPFTIIVNLDASLEPSGLPLTLPFTLSSQAPSNIECLLRKYIPAHCQVIFRYS